MVINKADQLINVYTVADHLPASGSWALQKEGSSPCNQSDLHLLCWVALKPAASQCHPGEACRTRTEIKPSRPGFTPLLSTFCRDRKGTIAQDDRWVTTLYPDRPCSLCCCFVRIVLWWSTATTSAKAYWEEGAVFFMWRTKTKFSLHCKALFWCHTFPSVVPKRTLSCLCVLLQWRSADLVLCAHEQKHTQGPWMAIS